MKRGQWDRRTYKIAIFISTIVMIVLNKLFVIMPIVDIDWSDWWYPFTLFLLFLLLPTICCIGWALKNESHKSGILQATGFALIYVGIAAIWYAMWDATLAWEFPIPLYAVEIAYLLAIILCFVFAVLLRRR